MTHCHTDVIAYDTLSHSCYCSFDILSSTFVVDTLSHTAVIAADTLSLLKRTTGQDAQREEEDSHHDASRRIVVFHSSTTVGAGTPGMGIMSRLCYNVNKWYKKVVSKQRQF